MASHNDLGRKGEQIARRYLEERGYRILEANWTYGRAEIDLVALTGGRLIFVEVKTRSSNAFGEPEDFVGFAKQRLMERAANGYINRLNFNGEIRFDIISILFDREGGHRVRHIEDAFWPD